MCEVNSNHVVKLILPQVVFFMKFMCGEENKLASIRDSSDSSEASQYIDTLPLYRDTLIHSDPYINVYSETNGIETQLSKDCFNDTRKPVVDFNETDVSDEDLSFLVPVSSLDEYSSLLFSSDNDFESTDNLLRYQNLFRSEASDLLIQEPASVEPIPKYMPSNKSCAAFEQLLKNTEVSSVVPHTIDGQERNKPKAVLTNLADFNFNHISDNIPMGLENTWNDDRRITLSPVSNYPLPLPAPPTTPADSNEHCDRFVGPENEPYTTNLDTFFSSHETETDTSDTGAEPGVCGLRNLGNTCYMGAGIQCMVATQALLCYFLKESPAVNENEENLTCQFTELVQKMWSGQYSIAYPLKFKQAFGESYSQFKESVQHDCHEFLTLLMDKLHQQLSLRNEDKQFNDEDGMIKAIYDFIRNKKQDVEQIVIPVDNFYGTANSTIMAVDNVGDNNDTQLQVSYDNNFAIRDAATKNINIAVEKYKPAEDQLLSSCNSKDTQGTAAVVDFGTVRLATSSDIIDDGPIAADTDDSNDSVANSRSTGSTKLGSDEAIVEIEKEEGYQNGLNSDNDNDDSVNSCGNNANGKRWKTSKESTTCFKSDDIRDGFTLKKFKMNDFNADVKEDELQNYRHQGMASDALGITEMKENTSNVGGDCKMEGVKLACGSTVETNNERKEEIVQRQLLGNIDHEVEVQVNGGSGQETHNETSSSTVLDLSPDDDEDCGDVTARIKNQLKEDKLNNRSVILDSFQGQFQNTVRCTVCNFESISYEPFMFVPVSLPDAGSKQLCVTFVPASPKPPIQCVLTMNKQDEVRKIKTDLQELLHIETIWPLIVADGLDHHICKLLDEKQAIKLLDDLRRKIYVFEQIMVDADVNCSDALLEASMASPSNKVTPTCVICLEEKNSDVYGHSECGCVLCKHCVEQSRTHYGRDEFNCPVCRNSLKIDIDLVYIEQESASITTRYCKMLNVPLVYRLDEVDADDKTTIKLFGSPNLLKLPNEVSNQKLYEVLRRRISYNQNFKLLLVNGQGTRCSRCMFADRCQGCVIAETGTTILQIDDVLAVSFSRPVEEIQPIIHSSMSSFRATRDRTLTLDDCIQKYFESEYLDIPWMCGRCNEKRLAARTYTVRRFPKYLMVQLKRFHMSNNCVSTKLEDRVTFPLRDFTFTHGSKWSPYYDLYACVCHSGSLTGGHYVAYTQHPVSGEWHCFNDENVTPQQPLEDDATAYILFYRKRDCSGMVVHTNIDVD